MVTSKCCYVQNSLTHSKTLVSESLAFETLASETLASPRLPILVLLVLVMCMRRVRDCLTVFF